MRAARFRVAAEWRDGERSSRTGGTGPQIDDRVGAPRTPRFHTSFQFARICKAHRVQQTNVSGGKGVGFAERAHGHVLRGPFANAGNLAEASEKILGIHDFVEARIAREPRPGTGLPVELHFVPMVAESSLKIRRFRTGFRRVDRSPQMSIPCCRSRRPRVHCRGSSLFDVSFFGGFAQIFRPKTDLDVHGLPVLRLRLCCASLDALALLPLH